METKPNVRLKGNATVHLKDQDIPEELLVFYQTVRSEVNLLLLPFFALDDKEVRLRKELEFSVATERDGKRLEIKWSVSANSKFGYPGPFDKKVHKVIEEILSELKLPIHNPIALGSLYSLCKRMGLTPTGSNYRKIKQALRRITSTTIQSQGAFYHKGKKRWVEDIFHLYERVVFQGEELSDGTIADSNYVFLNQWYLDNINAGYTKPLDYAYYKSLRNVIAQRLYEFLGIKFYGLLAHGKPFLCYSYHTLCQLLPLKPQKELKYARRQLKPAHELLRETGFLTYEWDGWNIRYFPGPRLRAEVESGKLGQELISTSMAMVDHDLDLDKGRTRPSELAIVNPEIRSIVSEILEVTGDEHSRPFYIRLAKLSLDKPILQDLIYRCLSEVKYEAHEGRVRKSKGALFTDKIKRYCQERGIDLGLKSS